MEAMPILTEQQVVVLKLIARGYTTKQMAQQLYCSPRTIDTHRRMICAALSVPNTFAAITMAIQQNIIEVTSLQVLHTDPKN
jgi:DNA-binding NarL/FixJ family response regulator